MSSMDSQDCEQIPAIRVMLMPKDTNAMGTIFGGIILSYIDQAGAVDRGQCAAEVEADQRRLSCAALALLGHALGQGAATHQLHPQAHVAVVRFGPVDLDHVGQAVSREHDLRLHVPTLRKEKEKCIIFLVKIQIEKLSSNYNRISI